ncbi:WD40 repeat [Macleaya cordata]|uniref:WD40 repeat n=1 Tax=Macleaya cordata TaxID=56857 RepID=A0A200R0P1_MACCD|nr:WD40 repeat [Macleaya cordata]
MEATSPNLSFIPSLNSQISQHSSTTHHHCISTFKGHSSYVFSLTFSGKFLYSGSSDKEIRICIRDPSNQSSSESTKVVAIGKGAVKSLVISGDKLFSAHQDHKIRVWQIQNNHNSTHHHHDQKYKLLATLPTLADRFLRFFPAKNYVQVRRHKKITWVHHVDTISALCLSKDETLLYSVSWDRTLKIWRTSDFKCLESVTHAHDDAINALALCINGFVYTGSADKKIKIWRKINGEKMKHSVMAVLDKHKSAVNALALSTDGSILYSGGCDCEILVWEKNYNNGGGGGGGNGGLMDLVGGLRGHTRAILCLVVISDLVCSGSADKTVRVWRRNNGDDHQNRNITYSCLAVMEGHTGPVKCLTASVDHNNSTMINSTSATSYLIYTGSLDCDIKVWQILVPST